ncbi:MAG: hypothetical protein U9N87_14335 [Planctomycetota bacterium]|nr:hypothetical protein [Planctomycetota bacterium]
MRRSIKILPVFLVLSIIPSMLGAVVLSEADMPTDETAVNQTADEMPNSHGPVLMLPTGPALVDPNPAILNQPIKPSDEKSEKPTPRKPAVSKPKAAKPKAAAAKKSSAKKSTPKTQAATKPADAKKSFARKPAEKTAKTSTPPAMPAPAPLEPLAAEMEALRDHVRKTLNYYSRQQLNTRDNTAAHILQACLAFGCDTTVRQGGSSGEPINGFTCLCWNYPCGGYNLLTLSGKHIAARIGYGLQSNPSQFLAVLALARVPKEYPVRVDDTVRTVADLVKSEMLSCRAGSDLSFKLIGLSRYLPPNATWKNDLGRTWSISRLVEEELDQVQEPAPCGGTHRLLALGYAVDRRAKQKQPIDGQFRRAKKFIDQYQDYALALQNPDGSWHPQFFKHQGQGGSTIDQVNSTGHILAWLAVSLPREKLDDQRIVRSVAFLSNLLRGRRYNSLAKTSSRDIAARMNALYALSVYDTRVFKPHDKAEEPAETEQPTAEEKLSARATARR